MGTTKKSNIPEIPEMVHEALICALNLLITLNQEHIEPQEAGNHLRSLQAEYLAIEMHLLWEKETYNHSFHYDLLLHLAKKGTISLSFCADHALPWPMRGVQHWHESDLVRVNTTVLTIEQAMACLDFLWEEQSIIERLLNFCLIQEELTRNPIELSNEELQQAIDGFRRAHKLYRQEETYHWMEAHGMTHEQFEHYITDEALIRKLRERLTQGHVEHYFEEHHTDFDSASIAQILFSDAESAHHAYQQLHHEAANFYEVAQQHFLTTTMQPRPSSNPIFSILQRGQGCRELARAVFAASPNDIIKPVQTNDGYVIAYILSFTSAQLNQKTCYTIEKILFDNWLRDQREMALIEWYWGKAKQASAATD